MTRQFDKEALRELAEPLTSEIDDLRTDLCSEIEALRKTAEPLTSEIDDLRTAITLDLCSEIEETRARISGITSAIGGLVFPAYLVAGSLAVIAYSVVTR